MLVDLVYRVLLGIPAAITKQVLAGIKDEVDRERLITQESIKQKLQEFQLKLQDGELTEEQYEEIEAVLIQRLRMVRELEKERS